MSNEWSYMPILKWKRGEQDALRYLRDDQWENLTPLIELQSIKVEPVTSKLRPALPDYIKKIAAQIKKSIPEEFAISIDTQYVCSDYPGQLNLLLVICGLLSDVVPNQIIPVVHGTLVNSVAGLSPKLLTQIAEYESVVLRIRTDVFSAVQIGPTVAVLAKHVKRPAIHVLLDQHSLVDKKHEDCVQSIDPYIQATTLFKCASITLGGGSFPFNLTGKKQGVTDISRVEWKIWTKVVGADNPLNLRYADYAVTNPLPMDEDIDPKNVNPSIAIRYASTDFWRLFKGQGFKGAATGQLHGLCKLLVTDKVYTHKEFSFGDNEYLDQSLVKGKNGIPWTWRRDATNHHLAVVIDAL